MEFSFKFEAQNWWQIFRVDRYLGTMKSPWEVDPRLWHCILVMALKYLMKLCRLDELFFWSTDSVLVFYSVLQCSTVFYSVLQCSTVFYSVLQCSTVFYSVLQCSTVFYSVLQCSTVFYSVLQCSTVFYSVLQCSTVFYSVLQCSCTQYIIWLASSATRHRWLSVECSRAAPQPIQNWLMLVEEMGTVSVKNICAVNTDAERLDKLLNVSCVEKVQDMEAEFNYCRRGCQIPASLPRTGWWQEEHLVTKTLFQYS